MNSPIVPHPHAGLSGTPIHPAQPAAGARPGPRRLNVVPPFHRLLSGLAVLLAATTIASAFPPAPHHVLYGRVRNQWGDPIDVSGATVFLQVSGRQGVRSTIELMKDPGINYQLKVPMDSLTRADVYQPTALGRNQSFQLKVQIGPVTYLPIEMIVTAPTIGQPAQSTRLDLTLGVDSDNDGLPDAWEQAIIAMFGGTLADITPNGDNDGDGISNLNEYLAGTLPFDPSDGFRLNLVREDQGAWLEFLAVRGRNYTIEASSNLQQWTPVEFRVVGTLVGPLQSTYSAQDYRQLQVFVPPLAGGPTNRYFRAIVR